MVGYLEVGGRSCRTWRFAFSSESVALGGILNFEGEWVGEVIPTNIIIFWGEDLDLERRVILGICTKHVLYLDNPYT